MKNIYPLHSKNRNKQPKVYFLIGLPGCGKRNYIEKVLKVKHNGNLSVVGNIPYLYYLSMTEHMSIESVCRTTDKKYADMEVTRMFKKFTKHNLNIVVHSSNLTADDRSVITIPENYRKIAVIFKIHDININKYKYNLRNTDYSFLTNEEVNTMIKKLEYPKASEKFDKFTYVYF